MTTLDITNPDVLMKLYKNLDTEAKTRLVLASLKGIVGFYDQLTVECSLVVNQKK